MTSAAKSSDIIIFVNGKFQKRCKCNLNRKTYFLNNNNYLISFFLTFLSSFKILHLKNIFNYLVIKHFFITIIYYSYRFNLTILIFIHFLFLILIHIFKIFFCAEFSTILYSIIQVNLSIF